MASGNNSIQQFVKVKHTEFVAIQWTGAGVALVFLIFRLAIRWKAFKRFAFDDFFAAIGWLFFLASNILWHTQLMGVYEYYASKAGRLDLIKDSDFVNTVLHFVRSLIAFNVLFNCCLWSVKFSFLAFFKQLANGGHGRNIWWWIVTSFTAATLVACIGDFNWTCSLGSLTTLISYCGTQKAKDAQTAAFRVNTAFDIATDCLILTIPVRILWNVRIPMRKKLALMGLFSLTVVTIAFALIRLLVVPKGLIESDITWTFTWSNIEMSISLIVANLGSFRQLYISAQTQKDGSNRMGGLRKLFGSRDKFTSFFRSKNSSSDQSNNAYMSTSLDDLHNTGGTIEIAQPKQAIYVREEFTMIRSSDGKEKPVKSPYISIPPHKNDNPV